VTLPSFLLGDLADRRVGETVVLDGDEGRHAVVVKRIRAGERIELTDGAGVRARVVVESTTRATLAGAIEDVVLLTPELPTLTVVQAIPKGDRGELTVQVLTEVGADVIVPWAAERCVAVWKGERAAKAHGRWVSTSRAAAKQARRGFWPAVADVASTDAVARLVAQADLAVVLHEAAEQPLAELSLDGVGSLVLVVGPEGGLTDGEVRRLADAGAHVVRLGRSVLRTSSAGLAGAAALLSRTPRWR
jgi:16S rRNA (uracil1498-N3)-methyltransferase